jgi:hypothetical protein
LLCFSSSSSSPASCKRLKDTKVISFDSQPSEAHQIQISLFVLGQESGQFGTPKSQLCVTLPNRRHLNIDLGLGALGENEQLDIFSRGTGQANIDPQVPQVMAEST